MDHYIAFPISFNPTKQSTTLDCFSHFIVGFNSRNLKFLLTCSFLFQKVCHSTGLNVLQGCEKEVAEAANDASDEAKSESIMRLSWALVHSRQPDDVQRGIAMLEGNIQLQ